jgi:hypothetical protein
MPKFTGKLADPAWREERARKAALARNSVDAHIRALVESAPALTTEQADRLRALLGGVEPSAQSPSLQEGKRELALGEQTSSITTDTPRHHRARVARAAQLGDANAVASAKADLKAANLAAHIQRVVDSMPPLTETQRARLAALLLPAKRGAVDVTKNAGAPAESALAGERRSNTHPKRQAARP